MYYDDEKDMNKVTFSFIRTDYDSSSSVVREYLDLTPWTKVLNDFITFLEGAGYIDVRRRVSVEESPFLGDEWEGPTHSKEDIDDWK